MTDTPNPLDVAVAHIIRVWGDHYEVWHADNWFHARAKAGSPVLHASSAQQLLVIIADDHARRSPRPTDQGSL